MPARVVTVERFIPASPYAIFDVLADPSRHAEIDGSGTVKASRAGAPERLSLGATFGMDMQVGVPYRIKNTVVEFEEGGSSPGGTSAGTSGATGWSQSRAARR